jgi:hypothetical protein
LAQQLTTTAEVVTQLVAARDAVAAAGAQGPQCGRTGDLAVPPNRPAPGRNRVEDEVQFNRAALPKLGFPKFCGDHPRIWIDKCCDCFHIYNIPQCMWTTVASLHMEDNAAKWLQVYKLKVGLGDRGMFVAAVEEKFGAYDYRKVVQDLLALRQEGNLEDYIREFEAIQFQVSMFNTGFDELFFTSHFVNGLKDEIRGVVQAQLLDSVDRATLLAQNQQQIVDRSKFRQGRQGTSKVSSVSSTSRGESSQSNPTSSLWKERQLRDFRRANNLCYFCGEKFDAEHLQKCTKRNKSQLHVLVVNDLDAPLTEDTLNQLEIEDVLTAEMGQLSLNAISGTKSKDSMRIRALVHNKVM